MAYPGVFSPIEAFGSMWFSKDLSNLKTQCIAGAAIYETDVISPILHCQKLGYKEEDIIIDVILGGNPILKSSLASLYNSLMMAQRSLELLDYYEIMFGLLRAK